MTRRERAPKTRLHPAGIPVLIVVAALLSRGRAADGPIQPDAHVPDGSLIDRCLLCHSTREMQRGPILDGWPSWYLEEQVRKFQSGIRGSDPSNRSAALMASAVRPPLSDADLARVATELGERPRPRHRRTVPGDPDRGRVLYARCAGCHGQQGEGNRTLRAPPLDVIEDWFLVDQLRAYLTGRRGSHPEDLQGRLMQSAMQGLTLSDVRDIVRYITETKPDATDSNPACAARVEPDS